MNILDIAAAAGVSSATVSRVLNNGKVSPELKSKVEATIRAMNYLPNNLARSLITGKSMNIGVLTHSLSNSYAGEFVDAVGERLRELNYRQFVASASSVGASEEEAKYVSSFLSQKVDGIIMHDLSEENYSSGFFLEVSRRVPLVIVHSFVDGTAEINSVILDQVLGMRRVMDHLLGLGHRKIWFVRSAGYSQDQKERVWREEMTALGCPPGPDDLIYIPDGDNEKGVHEATEAVAARLQALGPPTAIFACNDIQGVGTQAALRQHGLRIPDDVSLVAHDNTILAEVAQISSVDMKRSSVGHATVDLLMSIVQGKDKEIRRVYLTPDIVHRGSTRKL
jgi:LacI family transcriptional regulator